MDKQHLWKITLDDIEVGVSPASFQTWLQDTWLKEASETKVVIACPSDFNKSFLENKFHEKIRKALKDHLPGLKEVEYVVEPRSDEEKDDSAPLFEEVDEEEEREKAKAVEEERMTQTSTEEKEKPKLNPRYTFDSFVSGEGNKLAYSAAQKTVESPGTAYNPLFIYGGVGLGKTHLLQAVGNKFIEENPDKSVLYVTSEHFTNEYVDAIRNNNAPEFRETYRDIDCLLFDDIQFLSGKEGAQEAFFWTFNDLYEDGQQLVIASDKTPKQIPALEERLRSRLEWGLIVDIAPPDYETRLAIIQSKADEYSMDLPEEAEKKIAKIITNNVREIEGALKKIEAYTQLSGDLPSEEEIDGLISGLSESQDVTPSASPEDFVKAVCQYFKVQKEELFGRKRHKEIVFPRQLAIYLLREELDLAYERIGNIIGGRDHTTVMHGYKKIKEMVVEDPETLNKVKEIKGIVYNE